jgi:hypothetical protein
MREGIEHGEIFTSILVSDALLSSYRLTNCSSWLDEDVDEVSRKPPWLSGVWRASSII